MFCGPHIEGKIALSEAVLRRRLSRATYVVKFYNMTIFLHFMALLTTFLPKQH
jgi:hypothetical protein